MHRYDVSFRFTARDEDGLPVLRESYNNEPRASQFTALLQRVHEENETQIGGTPQVTLPVVFVNSIGMINETASDDERRRYELEMRDMHGAFEVTVTLTHVGLHMVTLKGPGVGKDGRFGNQVPFTWEVTLNGICPPGLVSNEAGLCECDRGMEPNTGGGEGPCSPCASGYVKTLVGNELCITCQALVWQTTASGELSLPMDMARTESDLRATSIRDCGCREGMFLTAAGNASDPTPPNLALDIGKECHNPQDEDFLDLMQEWVRRSNSTCCINGDCSEFNAKRCLWSTCRKEFIRSIDLVYGRCTACPEFASCSVSSSRRLSSRQLSSGGPDFRDRDLRFLSIRAGYWRSSPLSPTTVPCLTDGVCVGSVVSPSERESGTREEWLCRDGHMGPLCEKCMPYHFKENNNFCRQCDNSTRTQGLFGLFSMFNEDNSNMWVPFMVASGAVSTIALIALLSIGWAVLTGVGGATSMLTTRLFAACACAVGLRMMRRLRRITGEAQVIMPKVKILISMMQVQEGLVPTFQITLPELFTGFLKSISVWQVDVPLDCFYPVSFHHKLVYKTLTPLVTIVLLLLYKWRLKDREQKATVLNWVFFVIFLFYPSCSAIIFRCFSCQEFDDGSSFLRADLSINCGSGSSGRSHQILTSYATLMLLIWPLGVPVLYGIVVWQHSRPLRRFAAIHRMLKLRKAEYTFDADTMRERIEAEIEDDMEEEDYEVDHIGDMKNEIEGEVKDRVVGKLEEIAGKLDDGVADEWGKPENTAGAVMERNFVTDIWRLSQPSMGFRFEEGSPTEKLTISEAWPNYEMTEHLLSDEDYTVVQISDRAEEEEDIMNRKRRGERGAANVPLSRASSEESTSSTRQDDKTIDTRASFMVDYSAFEMTLDGVDFVTPPDEILKEVGVLNAAMVEWNEATKQNDFITKDTLLKEGDEDEKAFNCYRESSVGQDVEWRAQKRWYKERAWGALSLSRKKRELTRSQKADEVIKIQELLLNKDWNRFSKTHKAMWLGEAGRLNRPMKGDVVVKVDGYDLRKPETYIVVHPQFVHVDLEELKQGKETMITHTGSHYLGPDWLPSATAQQRADWNYNVWTFIRDELTFVSPQYRSNNLSAMRPLTVSMLCEPPWFATGTKRAELDQAKRDDDEIDKKVAEYREKIQLHKANLVEKTFLPRDDWTNAMNRQIASMLREKTFPVANVGVRERLAKLDANMAEMQQEHDAREDDTHYEERLARAVQRVDEGVAGEQAELAAPPTMACNAPFADSSNLPKPLWWAPPPAVVPPLPMMAEPPAVAPPLVTALVTPPAEAVPAPAVAPPITALVAVAPPLVLAQMPPAPRTASMVDAFERCEQVFRLLDKNGDGVLSRIEIIQACRKDEGVANLLRIPQQVRQEDGSRDFFEAMFQMLDADDSKSVSLEEFQSFWVAHVMPQMGPAPTQPSPSALLLERAALPPVSSPLAIMANAPASVHPASPTTPTIETPSARDAVHAMLTKAQLAAQSMRGKLSAEAMAELDAEIASLQSSLEVADERAEAAEHPAEYPTEGATEYAAGPPAEEVGAKVVRAAAARSVPVPVEVVREATARTPTAPAPASPTKPTTEEASSARDAVHAMLIDAQLKAQSMRGALSAEAMAELDADIASLQSSLEVADARAEAAEHPAEYQIEGATEGPTEAHLKAQITAARAMAAATRAAGTVARARAACASSEEDPSTALERVPSANPSNPTPSTLLPASPPPSPPRLRSLKRLASMDLEQLKERLEQLRQERAGLLLKAEQLKTMYVLHNTGSAYKKKDLVKMHVIRAVPCGVHTVLAAVRIRVLKTNMPGRVPMSAYVKGLWTSLKNKGRREVRNTDAKIRRRGTTLLVTSFGDFDPRDACSLLEFPDYMRTLTDPYDLNFAWWEIFESLRKVLLVGVLVFLGEGTVGQLTVGLFVCVICVMAYNNLKPYAAWQNDMLQQIAQLNIFITLLAAVAMRVEGEEQTPQRLRQTEQVLGILMVVCTSITSALAIPTALLERIENPREDSRKYVGRAEKVLRAGRKSIMINIVYVQPEFQYASDLRDAYLRAEEEGGVPYRGGHKMLTDYLTRKMELRVNKSQKRFTSAKKRLTLDPSLPPSSSTCSSPDPSRRPGLRRTLTASLNNLLPTTARLSYFDASEEGSGKGRDGFKFVARVGFRAVMLPADPIDITMSEGGMGAAARAANRRAQLRAARHEALGIEDESSPAPVPTDGPSLWASARRRAKITNALGRASALSQPPPAAPAEASAEAPAEAPAAARAWLARQETRQHVRDRNNRRSKAPPAAPAVAPAATPPMQLTRQDTEDSNQHARNRKSKSISFAAVEGEVITAPSTASAARPPPLARQASSMHTSYTVRGSVMQYEAEHPTQESSKQSSQSQPSSSSSWTVDNVEIKIGQSETSPESHGTGDGTNCAATPAAASSAHPTPPSASGAIPTSDSSETITRIRSARRDARRCLAPSSDSPDSPPAKQAVPREQLVRREATTRHTRSSRDGITAQPVEVRSSEVSNVMGGVLPESDDDVESAAMRI